MNRYLVIYYDRQEADETGYDFVVADGPMQALERSMRANRPGWSEEEIEQEVRFSREMAVEVDNTCCVVTFEDGESDTLIFKLP